MKHHTIASLFPFLLLPLLAATTAAQAQRKADVRLNGQTIEARIVDPKGVHHYFVFEGAGIGGPVEIPATLANCASPVVITIGPRAAHLVAGTQNIHQHTVVWVDCEDVQHRWVLPAPVGFGWLPGTAQAVPTVVGFGCGSQNPLGLDIDAPPVLGTSRTLVLADIPTGSTFAAVYFATALAAPAYPLAAVGVPATECYVFLDVGSALLAGTVVAPGTTASVPLVIPASPALTGFVGHLQALTLSPGENPAGLLTSNGLSLVFGQ